MKYLLLFVCLNLISCDPDHVKNQIESTNIECGHYPRQVDSLNLKDLYYSAIWYIYTWNCDLPYKPKIDSAKTMFFGQLGLEFDSIEIKNDTVKILFDFVDNDRRVISTGLRNFITLNTGVGYSISTRRKLFMISPDGYTVSQKGVRSRFQNPLQPEVLLYIKNNKKKIHPCFDKFIKQKNL